MDLVQLFLFALPAYLANGAPVLFGGGPPLDGGRHFGDGRRMLGSSKTVRGFWSGVCVGTFTGIVLAFFLPQYFIPSLAIQWKVAAAFLLSLGAMLGDLLGSFVKRRMNLSPGEPFFVTDQLLFFALALALCWPLYMPAYDEVLVLFIMTFALHVLTNIIAHRLKLKDVPW